MQTQMVYLNISCSHDLTDPNPIPLYRYWKALLKIIIFEVCMVDGEIIINTDRTTVAEKFLLIPFHFLMQQLMSLLFSSMPHFFQAQRVAQGTSLLQGGWPEYKLIYLSDEALRGTFTHRNEFWIPFFLLALFTALWKEKRPCLPNSKL